jgi:hypothetical protein
MVIWLCHGDLHHNAGRDSGGGEEGGRAMSSVAKPDHAKAGGLGDASEGAVDGPRLDLAAGAVYMASSAARTASMKR